MGGRWEVVEATARRGKNQETSRIGGEEGRAQDPRRPNEDDQKGNWKEDMEAIQLQRGREALGEGLGEHVRGVVDVCGSTWCKRVAA